MNKLTTIAIAASIIGASISTASAYTQKQERYIDRLVTTFQDTEVRTKNARRVAMGATAARCRIDYAIDEHGIDAVMTFAKNPKLELSDLDVLDFEQSDIFYIMVGEHKSWDGRLNKSSHFCPAGK